MSGHGLEAGAFGPVDITLTTIAARLPSLPRTLESLLAQSYRTARVHLYVSAQPHLLDEGIPEVPPEIAELAKRSRGRLRVHHCPNWGPYRKLLPHLRRHWGESRLVVTADDDTIYPETWLERMLEAYGIYGCVIAYRGHRLRLERGEVAPYRSWMRSGIEENPSRLILPTGKDGVLYNTAFFPAEVLDVETAMHIAPTVDDLWFRWHLALNRIPVHLINIDYAVANFSEAGAHEGSLYTSYNLSGGNDAAVAALERHFRLCHGFGMADLSGA